MFGYVRAYLPELKMREYEYYAPYTAGSAGPRSLRRLSLPHVASYDFVFCAGAIALAGEANSIPRAAHPAKRNEMLPSPQLDFWLRRRAAYTTSCATM